MANSPIQIVLNTNDFISAWERPPGGGKKDFYEGNDREFVEHKEKLSAQLSGIKSVINENEMSEISYAKLILKQSALAKSHRPTSALFKKELAPIVGGGDLGELYVELTPDRIDEINDTISKAEDETRWKEDKSGKMVAKPSKLRSEVGSIDEILPYTVSDKRNFSVQEGLDWVSNPQTGGAYIVELFETPPERKNWDTLSSEKFRLFQSFITGLSSLGDSLVSSRVDLNQKGISMIGVRLEDTTVQSERTSPTRSSVFRRQSPVRPILKDVDSHARLLNFLDRHPLVRKIILPPIISKSEDTGKVSGGDTMAIPRFDKSKSYPKVAIVDGGTSSYIDEWVEERWGILSPEDKDNAHGTFIAGLLLGSKSLNGVEVCNEVDGCRIVDLDILPIREAFETYYPSVLDFFNELETAVKVVKEKTGVRVFNFSLNIEEHVSSDGYSPFAKMLDKIAEENDVIFIISAGNTRPNDFRKEWPSNVTDALKILATSRNDTIRKPAESARNLSVAALNPPNLTGLVPYAPSCYSCRGPGMRVGLKPDLAHVGGAGTKVPTLGHGLRSINAVGEIVDGCGTSYASPHVAKTVAHLDNHIEGFVSRESLIGLTIHHAVLPEALSDEQLKEVAKHLVGFGMPRGSEEMLDGNDNSITLVFANRIHQGRKMSFGFTWPNCLVKNGKCYGDARLTIVSTPPFDYKYGAEFVRVNIEGHLRQEQADGTYKGRLTSIYLPESISNQQLEKNQIEHSFKWSPIKVMERNFKGVGPGTNWRLDVEYLARDGEILPSEGVPFTAILTISDLSKKEPVFQDMRQTLQSLGVQSVDIRTAARIMSRV